MMRHSSHDTRRRVPRAATRSCANCGVQDSDISIRGLCPGCLLSIGLQESSESGSGNAGLRKQSTDWARLRNFGDYELLEETGRGGMGVVFKARQASLNRIVALKMIAAGQLASAAQIQRFHTEAEAAASLDHPNIVPIYEIGEHDGRHFFTMKHVDGGTLTDVLRQRPFTPRAAAELMAVIARAVHYAHRRGILHRDLKPGNILLDSGGRPHVTDFGLAKLLETESSFTQSHALLGTPSYMAPEQAAGDMRQLTTSADVFSLGAILYELLTGRPPFRGATPVATMREVADKAPDPPRSVNRAVDRDLETICLKCLEKDPQHRYGSAEALAEDLECWSVGKPIRAKAFSRSERIVKWARREPTKAALIAVSCIAVTALFGIGLGQIAFHAERLQREKTEEALEEAERQRTRAVELERLRLEDAEVLLELNRLDAWHSSGEEDYALAYLATIVRRFPSNALIAQRVLTELARSHLPRRLWGPLRVAVATLSPDGNTLAVAISEHTVQFWDLQSGRPMHRLHSRQTIRQCTFDSSGEVLATVDGMGIVRLWDAKSGQPARGISFQLTIGGQRVHLLDSGKKLLAFSYSHWDLWDLSKPVAVVAQSGSGGNVDLARLSPDGRLLAFSPHDSKERSLVLVDLESNAVLSTNYSEVHAIEFSPKGDLLAVAAGGELKVVRIPDLEPARSSIDSAFRPQSAIRLLRFTPDGNAIVAVAENGGIQYWPLSSDQSPWNGQLGSRPNDVQFSPDGTRIVIAAGNQVHVLRSDNGRIASSPIQSRTPVLRAWFNKDGQRLLTASADGVFSGAGAFGGILPPNSVLRIWDAHTLPPPRQLEPQTFPFRTAIRVANNPYVHSVHVEPIRPAGAVHPQGEEPVPVPIPSWVPAFLEMFSGVKLDTDGRGDFVEQTGLYEIADQFQKRSDPDIYERFARWALLPHSIRPKAPLAFKDRAKAQQSVSESSLDDLRNMIWFVPTNGLAMAHLARSLYFEERYGPASFGTHYEFASLRAVEIAPDEPEAWLTRLELLRLTKRTQEALATADEAVRRLPNTPAIALARALLLEEEKRPEEALVELERVSSLVAGRTPELDSRSLAVQARLLRSLGRVDEAEAKERAAQMLPIRPDWPSWGGGDPGRNMYSSAQGLPAEWDPGRVKPGTDHIDLATTRNVKWVANLGSQHYGTTVVAGGRIYVGTNNDNPRDPKYQGDRSILLVLSEQTGAFLWQLAVPKLASGKVNDWEMLGICSSVTVEGDRVYLVSSRGEVLCLTTEGLGAGNVGPFREEGQYLAGPGKPPIQTGPTDADIVWRYDMMDELGVFPHNASATSVLVLGDLVYVGTGNGMDWTHSNVPSPRSPSLIALDKRTGKLVAEEDAGLSSRILHAQWSSPSAGSVNGRQLIFFGGGDGWCYAFDATPVAGEEGGILKTVWKADCNPPAYRKHKYPNAEGPSEIIATPVFWNNRVYVAIGQDPEHGEGVGNLVCLDATQEGDITHRGVIWSSQLIRRTLAGVSITPDGLLFVSDYSGFVHCFDAETGKRFWEADMKAHMWGPGSTLVADGKVYVGDEDGDFVVFEASKRRNVLSECNVGAPIYTMPVTANGVLYVASNERLYAIEHWWNLAGTGNRQVAKWHEAR